MTYRVGFVASLGLGQEIFVDRSFSFASLMSLAAVLSACSNLKAQEFSCSATDVQTWVVQKNNEELQKLAMLYSTIKVSPSLSAIRTVEKAENRLVCKASLTVLLEFQPGIAQLRGGVSGPGSKDIEIPYLVEKTDDGEIYVTLLAR